MAPVKKAAAKKATAKKAAQRPRKTAAARKATVPARGRPASSDEILERLVRQAEHAGQTALIERRDYSEDEMAELTKALDHRVKVNLAATGGRPVQSMAGTDPEVIKLEQKYRRAPKPQPATDGEPVNE
jgi:hypothetical protein